MAPQNIKKALTVLFLLGIFFGLTYPRPAWAVDPDIYEDNELARQIQLTMSEYKSLYKDQKERLSEYQAVQKQIASYEQTLQKISKKDKKLNRSLAENRSREKVLKEKIAFYKPKINQKKSLYKRLKAHWQNRQKEKNALPKTSPGNWTLNDAGTALKIYTVWRQRAEKRLKYYKTFLAKPANSVQQAAQRQNHVQRLTDEYKMVNRKYWQIEKIYRDLQYRTSLNLARKEMETPPPPTTEFVKQTPSHQALMQPSPPGNTPTPTPIIFSDDTEIQTPGQDDFLSQLGDFTQEKKILVLLVLLLAAFAGLYVGMNLSDPLNPRQSPFSAAVGALGITLLSAIPFFGPPLAFLAFILLLLVYYRLPLETLTRVLLLSLGITIVSAALGVTLLWLIISLIK